MAVKNKGGRPKGTTEVSRKMRFIVEDAINIAAKQSNKTAAEMLAGEILEHGMTHVVPKFASFWPREVHAEVTTESVEDYVLAATAIQMEMDEQDHDLH